MGKRKVHPRLASARAFWRLSAKAWKARNIGEAISYRQQADRIYAIYEREMEAKKRREASEKAYKAELAKKIAARSREKGVDHG